MVEDKTEPDPSRECVVIWNLVLNLLTFIIDSVGKL